MKKTVIFLFLALFVGMAYGQKTMKSAPATSTISDTVDKPRLAGELLSFGMYTPYGDANYLPIMQTRWGMAFPNKMFWLVGIGYNRLYTSVDIPGSSVSKTLTTWSLRFPLTVGYAVGDPKKWGCLRLQGGLLFNYVLSSKYGNDSMKIDDHTHWGGLVKATIGTTFGLFAEYDFGFESGSDGIWYFGMEVPF